MSCTLVDVYTVSDETKISTIRVVNWSRDIWSKDTAILITFGRTTNFTRFFQLQVHKIHLTKTQPPAVPLQLHVKSQNSFFVQFSSKIFEWIY